MEKLLIQGLADCFTKQDAPIVIFCDWNDAEKIRLDIIEKTNAGMHGHFDNKDRVHRINYFSCFFGGTEFVFCDINQTAEFLEIYKSKI